MLKLTPQEFVEKWENPTTLELNESQMAQTHFNDICALVGHSDPIAFGDNETFSFEFANIKPDGRKGRADVFYRARFIWEYKGFHANLDKAYQQLLFYKDFLDNPPLLITCDIRTIIIHTNYTNTVKKSHVILFEDLIKWDGLDKLNTIFNGTIAEIEARFKPENTREYITQATANEFMSIVEGVRGHIAGEGLKFDSEEQAHFFIRLLFCLFAESIGLLPDKLFTKIVEQPVATTTDIKRFVKKLRNLFSAMREDIGVFGWHDIPYFNGGLFDNDFVPPSLPTSVVKNLLKACRYDWSQLEPSVFGTLFERILDVTKRHQIGAHYTGKADIELIIKPVLMQPLLDEWDRLKGEAMSLIRHDDQARAFAILQTFATKIAALRVLDPACGSGNFLYIALQHLLNLQKEVIVFAERYDLPMIPLTVGPQQLHGMEINVYAHELAQITVWIGYIQWRYENGLEKLAHPILQPLNTIKRMDAILGYDEQGNPIEPEWVAAEVIVGNPPFLGSYKMRSAFGNKYVEDVFKLYDGEVPAPADLVCYWFIKSLHNIQQKRTKRVGLLSTNSIRTGFNRKVLDHVKQHGDIFMAWSDRPWLLEGAAVRISMVGFDDGTQKRRYLDGIKVTHINSDLTTSVDITKAKSLPENKNIVYKGIMKGGPFEITTDEAAKLLKQENPSGKPNSDVIKPRIAARDIVSRPLNSWVIDFGVDTTEAEAATYLAPFAYIEQHVKPVREQNRRERRRAHWWLFGETNPTLRQAVAGLTRYIVTPETAKYRIFIWMTSAAIPDYGIHTFAREDDYFLGVLQSQAHEMWSLRLGSSLGPTPKYNSSITFETFPMPWPPGQEPSEADNSKVYQIADYARQLVAFRDNWLNPPADSIEIGEKVVQKRTLTNLYNALEHYRAVKPGHENAWGAALSQIVALGDITPKLYLSLNDMETLDFIHAQLDRAVLAAYGWEADLDEEEILANLLALNEERTKS